MVDKLVILVAHPGPDIISKICLLNIPTTCECHQFHTKVVISMVLHLYYKSFILTVHFEFANRKDVWIVI